MLTQNKRWCRSKTKAMLLMLPDENKSHVVDVAGWKQKPWCWSRNKTKSHVVNAGAKQKPYCSFWNKTNDMLLMLEQNRISIVDFGTKQMTCCRMKTKARSRSKTKAILFISEQNKRHFVDAGAKQNQHRWFPNKTNDMLLMLPAQTKAISLMPEKNKSSTFISKQYKRYLVNAGTKQKQCNVDPSLTRCLVLT